MHFLLLSRDEDIITTVRSYLEQSGDGLFVAYTTDQARHAFDDYDYDGILMDCSIRPTDLISFATDLGNHLVETVVLLLGPLDPEQRENLGKRLSAHYSIDKPLRPKSFADIMQKMKMRSTIVRKAGLIGRSQAMEEIIQTIMQIGPTPITVLLTGESGSGKEVIGRAIHHISRRADKPFLAVNCGALAEGVLESELFGHEKGAFTGAVSRRTGMFEKAEGGTIFLDEIGEIPHSTQIRLLRVLEEKELMRVGGTTVIPVDVRVLAATNRDLLARVEEGAFRRDLYYRIKVLEIEVPPLRKRPEDIPLLVDRLTRLYTEENNLPPRRFSDEAKSYLSRSQWTGNVRELRNFIESCLALTDETVVELADIPDHLLRDAGRHDTLPVPAGQKHDSIEHELMFRTLLDLKQDVREIKQMLSERRYSAGDTEAYSPLEVMPIDTAHDLTLEDMERQAIIDTLDQTGGNRRKAAERLGIGERTLYRKLKEYGIN